MLIKFKVSDYAQKTGDFAALSKTDLKLLALTYMLELEMHGSKYIKNLDSVSVLKIGLNSYLIITYNNI